MINKQALERLKKATFTPQTIATLLEGSPASSRSWAPPPASSSSTTSTGRRVGTGRHDPVRHDRPASSRGGDRWEQLSTCGLPTGLP